MRLALPAAASLALCTAAPALATGGYECRPIAGSGPTLIIAVGHTASARPISVTLKDGRRSLSTHGTGAALAVGQSWIDGSYLWLDLISADLTRSEAKLRAAFQPKLRFRPAIGTLVRDGRTRRVRCVEA